MRNIPSEDIDARINGTTLNMKKEYMRVWKNCETQVYMVKLTYNFFFAWRVILDHVLNN